MEKSKDALVATVEMVVWDNSTGLYPTWAEASLGWQAGLINAGRSLPFNLQNIGGDVNTLPALTGLTSFNIYGDGPTPEPASLVLAALGCAILHLRRKL